MSLENLALFLHSYLTESTAVEQQEQKYQQQDQRNGQLAS